MKKTAHFKRMLAEAKDGNEIEVLEQYLDDIKVQKDRQKHTKNGFIWTCAQQIIDQLTAERDEIVRIVIG